jgi:RHS repeat-associated protein
MTKVELPSNVVNTITLDGEGKRRTIEDAAGLRKVIWDLENILAETDSGGNAVAQYTLAPEAYGELISQRRSGATSFHHFAALGSTDRLTDSGANTLASYLYKAFGQQTVVSGSSPNRFTWVGKLGYYRQPDAADYWVRARIMKPTIGRWLSRDPIFPITNTYRYVGASPTVHSYPSGHQVRVSDGEDGEDLCYEFCMIFCMELLPPHCAWWDLICKWLKRRACSKLCKEQCKPLGPDWSECKKVLECECISCCARVCGENKVCKVPCYNWCAGHYPED